MASLLTTKETASKLGLHPKTFERKRAILVAKHGLTPIRVGRQFRFNSDQVDKLICKLTKSGGALYETATTSETLGNI